MNRREFFAAAGAIAANALTANFTARAKELPAPALHTKRRLVLVCAYPKSAAGTHDVAACLASRLERLLGGGSVEIEVKASTLGSIDALKSGGAHMTLAGEGANVGRIPALAFVSGLPGRFAHDPNFAGGWLTGSGQRLWHQAHQETGLLPLYAGSQGVSPGIWSRRPISSFSGLKIAAAPGPRADVLSALGTQTTPLAPADYADALSSGAVDAVELSSLEDAIALGVVRAAPYCLNSALAPHAGPLALTFAPSLWHGLPQAVRTAVRQDILAFAAHRQVRASENEDALKAALSAAFGCAFQQLNTAKIATIDRLSEAIIADYASRNAACRALGGAAMATMFAGRETDTTSTHYVNAV